MPRLTRGHSSVSRPLNLRPATDAEPHVLAITVINVERMILLNAHSAGLSIIGPCALGCSAPETGEEA